MLVNEHLLSKTETSVKFISYTGKWPNLCSGTLTLSIDGKIIEFTGYEQRFWQSSGSCSLSGGVTTGEWIIDVEKLPKGIRKYAAEIDRVINENIEHGCCGGCL